MEKNDKHPATVDEAVNLLMDELSFGDRTIIANIREEDLAMRYHRFVSGWPAMKLRPFILQDQSRWVNPRFMKRRPG